MNERKDQTDKQEESIVLLPCPFCGRSAELSSVGEPDLGGDPSVWRVDCNCMWNQHETKEQAVSAWNTRGGDQCRDGCKIKRAVKEMADSLTSNYTIEAPKSTGIGIDSPWNFGK